MTTLAANKPRNYELGDIGEYPVVASDIIYEGAAVGMSAGNARPLTAGDPFLGFAEAKVDNSSGSAGDKRVRVKRRGQVQIPVTGVTGITDVGDDVYASDDDTFTLTESTNTRIGTVTRYVSTGVAVVEFEAVSGEEAALTDSTTGTADGTVADVGASFSQSTLNNNFADLTAKVNYLLSRQNR